MAANFQSPEMVAVVSSSLILSVMVLISFRISSNSSFTGGDIEKVSSSVLGGDLQWGSSLLEVKTKVRENFTILAFSVIMRFLAEIRLKLYFTQ